MRDFIDQLEGQLVGAARADSRRGLIRRFSRSALALPRTSVAAIACVAAATALAVLVGFPTSSSTSSALAYPVLAQAPTDASSTVRHVPSGARRILTAAGADPRQARTIPTPWGVGYAMPAMHRGNLCLAAPDRFSHSWAASCGPGGGGGLLQEARGRAEAVEILPAGAGTPVVRYDNGTTRSVPLNHGVLAIEVRRPATITYRVGHKVSTLRLAPLGYCIPRPEGC